MSHLAPAIITVQGVFEPGHLDDVTACPFCGAARADAPHMQAIGVLVFGLACTWHTGTGVFRCSMPIQIPVQRDAEAVRARLRGLCDRFAPAAESAFGTDTMTRETFIDGLTRDGMRDAIRHGVQR